MLHEYQILGTADRATGMLRACRRYPGCCRTPSARWRPPNASRMDGTALRSMRIEVLARSCGRSTAALTSTTACARSPRSPCWRSRCAGERSEGGSGRCRGPGGPVASSPRTSCASCSMRRWRSWGATATSTPRWPTSSAQANLSTRSFYRHFESKDQLLCALYRREAEDAAARLNAKVDASPSPRAALDAWIDEILSLGQHRAKAARVRVLGSPGAMRAEGYAEETRHASKLLMEPWRRCSPPVPPTARSRWPTPRPMHPSSAPSSGPPPASRRLVTGRGLGPRWRARCGRSAPAPSARARWTEGRALGQRG